ncbi:MULTISPECIES: aminotransferase class I/II-fold pyridoxal phosphate-dependent enzyme [unclassified Enterococcus]|uniref:aminotransferase class I/II-fold pyridoxal phosphate-dependent enzyme n=1 Tax=unclassified Enterococcus TaxID=2608891 RepID=UPI001CE132CC|nr:MULTISPECIES: aminotransferase class I/II-fold pyridoxal phosphate-dependent enzyme [unclassified Enterococcus]MCA5014451.1 aminotransferase class I/II-fold pyridoxal phosphate-dependent enzyme [Enterococcus sp. S23]MCA5017435.1 aminotransferase class I/II-fold pyridoxal phosphate-dependent enzyme [Enterococcus sp. S22(2020)]
MKETPILLSPPDMTGKEQMYINDAFEKNFIAPVGENIDRFEVEVADYVSSRYAVAVTSGTAGLHLALIAANVQAGDIVLCSDFTFTASVNPILYQQAIPVLVDSEQETWNMDPEQLEQTIKKYSAQNRRPKAVVVTHIYGQLAKMEQIIDICQNYHILVIEDACEAMGTVHEKLGHAGTIGDLGVYSFNGNKIITTSGGGMVVTDNEVMAKRINYLSTQAKSNKSYYLHEEIGYNYRMSNILAGVGRAQLVSLEDKITSRRRVYEKYQTAFADMKHIQMIPEDPEYVRSNRWLSVVLLSKVEPKALMDHLKAQNIESRLTWNPMHEQPVFKNLAIDFFYNEARTKPVSEQLFAKGLCLPSGSRLSDCEQDRVIAAIQQFLKDE